MTGPRSKGLPQSKVIDGKRYYDSRMRYSTKPDAERKQKAYREKGKRARVVKRRSLAGSRYEYGVYWRPNK